jgi:putative transposase
VHSRRCCAKIEFPITRRLGVLLRREGMLVNYKRVYRLYREEGLSLRRRKRKRLT